MFSGNTKSISALLVAIVVACVSANSQVRVNESGTGGIHVIQGRIYLPDGSTISNSLVVKLESMNFGTVTVYTDNNGAFTFKALAPGNYRVVVDAGQGFEVANESVTIDPGANGIIRISAPQVFTVPVYLAPKRTVLPKNEILNAKLAAMPKGTQDLYEKARGAVAKGKPELAVTDLQQALAIYKDCGPCAIEIGKIQLMQGKLDEAASYFRRALEIDKNDFEAHINLGITLMDEKNYDSAEPELVTAALLDKTAVTPHYYIGLMYIEKKEYEVAQRAFETARSLPGGDKFPLLHRYLGGIYVAKGLNKQAVNELEKYLQLAPDSKDAAKIRQTISGLKNKI